MKKTGTHMREPISALVIHNSFWVVILNEQITDLILGFAERSLTLFCFLQTLQ